MESRELRRGPSGVGMASSTSAAKEGGRGGGRGEIFIQDQTSHHGSAFETGIAIRVEKIHDALKYV